MDISFTLLKSRETEGWGVETGMVAGHCLLIGDLYAFIWTDCAVLGLGASVYATVSFWGDLPFLFPLSTWEIFFFFELFKIMIKHHIPFLELFSMTLPPVQNWQLSPSSGVSIIPLNFFCEYSDHIANFCFHVCFCNGSLRIENVTLFSWYF